MDAFAHSPEGAMACRSGTNSGYRASRIMATLSLLATLMLALPSANAVESGETFKDWKAQCQEIKETGKESCFIFQNLTIKTEEGSRQLLHLAVGYPPDKQEPMVIFTLPLGISLPPGVSLTVDKGEPIRLRLEYCVPQGCKALFRLDTQWLASFKAGSKAQVTVQDGARRAIGIPVSLNGFTAGLKALQQHNQN